jgi:hypothetical protein
MHAGTTEPKRTEPSRTSHYGSLVLHVPVRGVSFVFDLLPFLALEKLPFMALIADFGFVYSDKYRT